MDIVDLATLGALMLHRHPHGDRLDLWVGHGEEGLARALAFGVQEVRGVVYPLGSAQPPESFALTSLPASLELLRNYLAHEPDLLALRPRLGEKTLRAQILQEHLRDAGYFSGKLTGLFGEVTHGSLARFMREFGLQGSGEELTEEVAAYLVAAVRRRSVPEPVSTIVEQGSPRETILRAQRTLRFLGAYRGRTHGVYDARFEEAVQKFQKGQGIISADEDPGAGRIGPRTREAIRKLWQRTHVAREARQVLFERKINTLLVEGGKVPGEFLAKGDRGTHVIRLQKLLADRGFFPKERISGLFGDVTHEAVLKYQFARGIIQNPEERGAGTVGPATIAEFYREEREKLYHLVRSQGWFVL
jgi:peptidoglycan hydrolase-like protein with peptidoglycan-binding domain